MALQSELDLLNARIQKHLQQNVLPHLTKEEREIFEERYLEDTHFNLDSFDPGDHALVEAVDTPASALAAIIAQSLFGRAVLMRWEWFRDAYEEHGGRLDIIPKELPLEFEKLRASIFGETSSYKRPREIIKTKTSSHSTDELLQSICAKVEEMNDSEMRQHKELETLFSALAEPYPGLRGLLCGVRHSFRDRDDRCAERQALISATIEYIEEIEPERDF
ncbi:hypothetical protein LEL_10044 [Akanthomyces lecanii RCEF 1005]|uniref:Uncharacterized protein n=1 Tax=Akanthomyces lecanii RCEF 1005 TaxID=1081108 RepID=A0A168ATD8_CORDF|nr:hypothetical protein LEL_10044 [Akanthomyces lecanii RCEF 1005]